MLGLGVATVCAVACTSNVLPDPENRAVAVPAEADVAAGATHDVLIVACQDRVTLADILAPAVVTTIFVGLGRLDALFYLPDAQAAAFIPSCEPIDFTVSDARVEGAGFEAEPTENPSAWKIHAMEEGEGTFRAAVTIGGERLDVESTLRAWTPNRVDFSPVCESDAALPTLDGWIPAGTTVTFTHRLLRDDIELAGYGVAPVTHPRLEITSVERRTAAVAIADETGAFTVTSSFDPGYSEDLVAYDAGAYDALTLTRLTDEVFFAGEITGVRAEASIDGAVPCIPGFAREMVIETPEICGFEGREGLDTLHLLQNRETRIVARAPGTCAIRVALPGTPLTDRMEIPVFQTFEALGLGVELDLSQSVLDMAVVGPDDVVVVGYDEEAAGRLDGLVLRRVGGEWSPLTHLRGSKTLRAVHARDGSIFAVGNDGNAARWDGSEWTVESTGIDGELDEVWVFSDIDVYAAGTASTLVRFDGTAWSSIPLGIDDRLRGLWGAPDGDIYFGIWGGALFRWDGTAAHEVTLPVAAATVNAIHGTSETDLWITSFNRLLHFDGVDFDVVDLDVASGDAALEAVPVADGTVYAVVRRGSRGWVDRVDGTRVVSMPLDGGPPLALAVDGNTVWALTADGLHRYLHDPTIAFRP